MRITYGLAMILLVATTSLPPGPSTPPAPLTVRHTEGVVHGFLAMRTTGGETVASGELLQVAKGDQVTCQLVFHFNDGSLQDETAVFSQRGVFRLLTDHLVQKGPSFPHPIDMSIDTATHAVTVRHPDDKGVMATDQHQIDLPANLANGLIITLVKNISGGPATFSFVAPTTSPRLVTLEVTPAGTETFRIAGAPRTATHYVIKVNIGGMLGVMARLTGKQPPDSHMWMLEGAAPAFVKSESPLYEGGPIRRIELVSPVWSNGR